MKPARRQFDPQAFLAKVGTGKTILTYRKARIIYAQGEEAVVGLLEAGQFFGEGCLHGQTLREAPRPTWHPLTTGTLTGLATVDGLFPTSLA